jgi:hypothetical protein
MRTRLGIDDEMSMAAHLPMPVVGGFAGDVTCRSAAFAPFPPRAGVTTSDEQVKLLRHGEGV